MKRKNSHAQWTEERIAALRGMYARGCTHTEMGRELGRSRSAIVSISSKLRQGLPVGRKRGQHSRGKSQNERLPIPPSNSASEKIYYVSPVGSKDVRAFTSLDKVNKYIQEHPATHVFRPIKTKTVIIIDE